MTLIFAVGDTLQKTYNPTTGAWTITRAPASTNAEVQALVNSIPGGPREDTDIDANENGERGSPYFGDCRYGKVTQ